jgi:opacity protein-like surface antigen
MRGISTIAALGIIMIPIGACAADLVVKGPAPATATDDWSGFYLGAYGGGGWGPVFSTSHIINMPPSTGPSLWNVGGPLGGARFGYNQVTHSILLSAEADLSAGNIQQEGIRTPGNLVLDRLNWLSTARARVGYTFGDTLLYGTGGIAVTGLFHQRTQLAGGLGFIPLPPGTVERVSGVFDTWTVGGGAEIKLDHRWSLTAEYLYLPLKPEFITPLSEVVGDQSWKLQLVRLGLNRSFGP